MIRARSSAGDPGQRRQGLRVRRMRLMVTVNGRIGRSVARAVEGEEGEEERCGPDLHLP